MKKVKLLGQALPDARTAQKLTDAVHAFHGANKGVARKDHVTLNAGKSNVTGNYAHHRLARTLVFTVTELKSGADVTNPDPTAKVREVPRPKPLPAVAPNMVPKRLTGMQVRAKAIQDAKERNPYFKGPTAPVQEEPEVMIGKVKQPTPAEKLKALVASGAVRKYGKGYEVKGGKRFKTAAAIQAAIKTGKL